MLCREKWQMLLTNYVRDKHMDSNNRNLPNFIDRNIPKKIRSFRRMRKLKMLRKAIICARR